MVTLFYRGSGDSDFKAKVMKWRYKELVARIPAKKMSGTSVQYYIEVKDQTGALGTNNWGPHISMWGAFVLEIVMTLLLVVVVLL